MMRQYYQDESNDNFLELQEVVFPSDIDLKTIQEMIYGVPLIFCYGFQYHHQHNLIHQNASSPLICKF